MATMMEEKDEQIGSRRSLYEPFHSFHQCWYPVLVANELGFGQVQTVKFADSKIVVFRGEDGAVRAVSSRCRHMGADVGLGRVVGNNIRCPYHHWQYDGSGACVHIPSGDKIPRRASLFRFPCEESQGLIWVFLGKRPSYPVPVVPECEEGKALSRSFKLDLPERLLVEPWAFGINVFDFAHFTAVHMMDFLDIRRFADENSRGWEADIMLQGEGKDFKGVYRLEMHGVSSIISYQQKDGEPPMRHVAASTPQGDDGIGMFFTVFAQIEDDSEEALLDAQRRLDAKERLHRTLAVEDLDILNSIEFGPTMLTKVDKDVAGYLRFVDKFPRTTIRELTWAN